MADDENQQLFANTYTPADSKSQSKRAAAATAAQSCDRTLASDRSENLGVTGSRRWPAIFRPSKKPSITIDTNLAQKRKGGFAQKIPVRDVRHQPKRVSFKSNARASCQISPSSGSSERSRQPLRLDTTPCPKGQVRTGSDNRPTPTVIVTPATEDFPCSLSARQERGYQSRPRSSIYSRATCILDSPDCHDVPPLPSLSHHQSFDNARPSASHSGTSIRDSALTPFEEDDRADIFGRNERSLSTFTIFDDDDASFSEGTSKDTTPAEHRTPDLLSSRWSKPIPRRSCGWWNVVTSPFSLNPSSNGKFERIYSTYAPGYGTNRQLDISEPQTAGLQPPQGWASLPRRSKSFSGAIHHGPSRPKKPSLPLNRSIGSQNLAETPLFQVGGEREPPKTGEASKYYDPNEDFGSPKPCNTVDQNNDGDIAQARSPCRDESEPENCEVPIVLGKGSPGQLSEADPYGDSAVSSDEGAGAAENPHMGNELSDDNSTNASRERTPSSGASNDEMIRPNPFDDLSHDDPFLSRDSRNLDQESVMCQSFGSHETDHAVYHGPDNEPNQFSPSYLDHDRSVPNTPHTETYIIDKAKDRPLSYSSGRSLAIDRQINEPSKDSRSLPETPDENNLEPPHLSNTESFHSSTLSRGDQEIWSPLSRETENTPVVETASIGTYLPSHELQRQRSEIDIAKPSPRAFPEEDIVDASRRDSVMDERSLRTGNTLFEGNNSSTSFDGQEKLLCQEINHRKASGSKFQCFRRRQRSVQRRSWVRFWPDVALVVLCLVVLAIIVVLAMTIHLSQGDVPIQAQWLNLTGFPPIPTGVSTIAQPNAVTQDSSCVNPSTMWSCAVPKEAQSLSPSKQQLQPNFRFEIRFKNDSVANASSLQPTNSSISGNSRRAFNPVTAGAFVKRQVLAARDVVDGVLFTPTPAPPSKQEQGFLGNTTDSNTAPVDGEETPFYISFLNASALLSDEQPNSHVMRRQLKNNTSKGTQELSDLMKNNYVANGAIESRSATQTSPFPNDASNIPGPNIVANGMPAPANLLAFPQAQPLRLFNRGSQTEHYGFYTYFDRSIFLTTIGGLNASATASPAPQDANGGAPASNATFQCTWSQTRFKVQIWTRKNAALLGSPSRSNGIPLPSSNSTVKASNSSANDFITPGSFPYPVTITLDRHGGDASQKGVYCYALDTNGKIMRDEATWQWEDRGAGGTLVNPAAVPGNETGSSTQKRSGGNDDGQQYGGVDGGSGGCGCAWENFSGT
ncbi:hypothetical protein EV356DRAFT_505454 [Viridothelium virens]|uniref:Glycoprotease family protein n=1 Tax=Viridothelium virens TaxID=1048519 RepID=A0A6A6H2G0_VIRVR|nr:hypothetical protein EV356DRAFT_505454 [Viridothelium virens]